MMMDIAWSCCWQQQHFIQYCYDYNYAQIRIWNVKLVRLTIGLWLLWYRPHGQRYGWTSTDLFNQKTISLKHIDDFVWNTIYVQIIWCEESILFQEHRSNYILAWLLFSYLVYTVEADVLLPFIFTFSGLFTPLHSTSFNLHAVGHQSIQAICAQHEYEFAVCAYSTVLPTNNYSG